MENSIVDNKHDLIEWIKNLDDLSVVQKLLDLKNSIKSSTFISDISSEPILKNDFDEQFAAGMTSDELLENIAAHIETMASEESSSVVSETQSAYVVKDDFDERFAKGLSSEDARKESKTRVREWWGK